MEYQSIKYNFKDKSLDIRFSKEENTIWMSQNDIALLFNKSKERVRKIISTISQKTLNDAQYRTKMTIVAKDRKTQEVYMYNLDIIKQVGYKIDPQYTNEFINWVNDEINKIKNQIIPIESNKIRFDKGEVLLDVTIEPVEDTVYLDKDQLVLLFDTTRQNLEYHISNIYKSGELEHTPTCKEILQVQF